MNLREGTRRLALLLGMVGAIFGGFIAYFQLQSTLRQRADHLRWTQLANSSVVKQEHDNWFLQHPPPQGFVPDASNVNRNGISVIHWTKSLDVASIETQDGETIYPTPAPVSWSYVAIAVLPLLGFFIPWGAVRAIGWVLAGFVAGPK